MQPSEDRTQIYRAPLFNLTIFCLAGGFVNIRSALAYLTQSLILLCVLGCGIAGTLRLKSKLSNRSSGKFKIYAVGWYNFVLV